MEKLLARHILPSRLAALFWGDRDKWGLQYNEQDTCWQNWQKTYLDFYHANQRKGIGTKVNDAGYKVMAWLNLCGKSVLEIGPGDIRHVPFWDEKPEQYLIADVQQEMLDKAATTLDAENVSTRCLLMQRSQKLPLTDSSVDIIVSFYSLEHIYPLAPYLFELKRILKPGGILAGAIPAEGGLAWGGGRMLTSRRWLKKNTTINPDKIICWEHPNFADQILSALDKILIRKRVKYWPIPFLPHPDFNLIIRFVYKKEG